MKIQLIAAGNRQPRWIREGVDSYLRRLPALYGFKLIEIPLSERRTVDPRQARREEGRRMLAAVAPSARIVCLDERGQAHSSRQVAARLSAWRHGGQDVALLVGGPDGLGEVCRQAAAESWSLSPLTLPHGIARLLVVEQLYRAHSIISGQPYHRD